MRICLVFSSYLCPANKNVRTRSWPGGAAVNAHPLAVEMVRHGHHVTVVTMRTPGCVAKEKLDGIEVIRVPALRRWGIWAASLSFALSCACYFLLGSRHNIVHLVSFDMFTLVPVIAAKLRGSKVIYQSVLMGSGPLYVRSGPHNRLAYWGLQWVDGLAGLSPPIRDAVENSRYKSDAFAILGYGVDLTSFHPARSEGHRTSLCSELGLKPERKYLCFVGAVVWRKGVDILFEAFEALPIDEYNLGLLIVGPDGFPETKPSVCRFVKTLKQRVDEAGLQERVTFTGYTERVADYLSVSDIFVFPSRREGLGMVILQAMATGLPCVVSELDRISQTLITSGKDGIIVEENTSQAYVQAVTSLLERPEFALHLGRNARKTIERHFDLPSAAEEYIQFYLSVL